MAHGGRKVQFEEMFPWEVAAAMAEAPLCFLPLGTLEWHGEHAAVGLDALKAHAVCVLAAQRSGGLVSCRRSSGRPTGARICPTAAT
jgi:creatinine amidohydrolase/Fe(II)-dependent formamide hydrolase-like protein